MRIIEFFGSKNVKFIHVQVENTYEIYREKGGVRELLSIEKVYIQSAIKFQAYLSKFRKEQSK